MRPLPESEGILPRASCDALHFHYARGFRKARRLAHMLDSLVRVSRRVRGGAGPFATDPVRSLRKLTCLGATPAAGARAFPDKAEAAALVSSVRRQASAPGGYNTGDRHEADPTTFPWGF